MSTQIDSYRRLGHCQDRDSLILKNLPMVKQVLGRVIAEMPDEIDKENLHSAGILGLVEAARNYDDQRGVDFPIFAYSRIRGAILDELRRNCPLPQQALQLWNRIRTAMQELPPPLTIESIAQHVGHSVDEVEECLGQVRMTRVTSYSEPSQVQPKEVDHQHPDTALVQAESIQLLANAIEQLPQTMRLAVTMYYRQDMRLKEIGEVLELSESRVSRIIAAAELRLRSLLEERVP